MSQFFKNSKANVHTHLDSSGLGEMERQKNNLGDEAKKMSIDQAGSM